MDKGEIIAEIRRMGAEYYGPGYGPRSFEWKERRDKSRWPSGNRVYQIVIGERASTKNVNVDDWKFLLGHLGLKYPTLKSGRVAAKAQRENLSLIIPEMERETTMAAHGKPFSTKRNPDSINAFEWRRLTFYDWRRRRYIVADAARVW